VPLVSQDLLTIMHRPDVNELSLQTVAEFYETYLCGHQYYYELRHKQRELRLRFKKGDLCHLLGIQHVLNGSDNVGETGFVKLKNGENTFVSLEKANKGGYLNMLYRMLYFPFVYQLIHAPHVVTNTVNQTGNVVKAQFSFHNGKREHYVELKLRRESANNPDFFVPVSFSESGKNAHRASIVIQTKKILPYDEGYVAITKANVKY